MIKNSDDQTKINKQIKVCIRKIPVCFEKEKFFEIIKQTEGILDMQLVSELQEKENVKL